MNTLETQSGKKNDENLYKESNGNSVVYKMNIKIGDVAQWYCVCQTVMYERLWILCPVHPQIAGRLSGRLTAEDAF